MPRITLLSHMLVADLQNMVYYVPINTLGNGDGTMEAKRGEGNGGLDGSGVDL